MRNINDLGTYLFPLLDRYPLQTPLGSTSSVGVTPAGAVEQKALDATAFREVHALIKAGLHLTPNGLDQIRSLKAIMNRARMA